MIVLTGKWTIMAHLPRRVWLTYPKSTNFVGNWATPSLTYKYIFAMFNLFLHQNLHSNVTYPERHKTKNTTSTLPFNNFIIDLRTEL